MSEWQLLKDIWKGDPINVDAKFADGMVDFMHLHAESHAGVIIGWNAAGDPISFRRDSNTLFRPHCKPESLVPHYECLVTQYHMRPGHGGLAKYIGSGGWFPSLEVAEKFWGADNILQWLDYRNEIEAVPLEQEVDDE